MRSRSATRYAASVLLGVTLGCGGAAARTAPDPATEGADAVGGSAGIGRRFAGDEAGAAGAPEVGGASGVEGAGAAAGGRAGGAGAASSGGAGGDASSQCGQTALDFLLEMSLSATARAGLPACDFGEQVLGEGAQVVAIHTFAESPGVVGGSFLDLTLHERAFPCAATLVIAIPDVKLTFVEGEVLRLRYRGVPSEAFSTRSLVVEDAAGSVVFLGRLGQEGAGDADVLRGLEISPVAERSCGFGARTAVGTRLLGPMGTCELAPLGRGCCSAMGSPLETRLWGLFQRNDTDPPGLGATGAIVMSAPERTVAKPAAFPASCGDELAPLARFACPPQHQLSPF